MYVPGFQPPMCTIVNGAECDHETIETMPNGESELMSHVSFYERCENEARRYVLLLYYHCVQAVSYHV